MSQRDHHQDGHAQHDESAAGGQPADAALTFLLG